MAAEALQFKIGGTEITSLAPLGTVPGAAIVLASGRNGTGVGVLRSRSGRLSWQAPGGVFGEEVTPSGDGFYCLVDGSDAGKYVRVQVWTDWLAAAETAVYLDDVYGNGLCANDLSAAEAASGLVTTVQVMVENSGSRPIADVRAWLAAATQAVAPAMVAMPRPAQTRVVDRVEARSASVGGGTAGARGLTPAGPARRTESSPAHARVIGAAWRPTGPATFALSADGTHFYSPTSEDDGNVIALGSLAAGASATLWVRRTVGAGAAPRSKALTQVLIGWGAFP